VLNFHIFDFSETKGDNFQPHLAGNMLEGWGFRFVGPNIGKIREILINLQKYSSREPLAGKH